MSSIAFIVKNSTLNDCAFEKRKKSFLCVRDTLEENMRSTREEKKSQFFIGGLVRLALCEDDDRDREEKNLKNCRQKEEKKNQLAGQGPNILIWLPMIHKYFLRASLEFFINIFSYTHLTWLVLQKVISLCQNI